MACILTAIVMIRAGHSPNLLLVVDIGNVKHEILGLDHQPYSCLPYAGGFNIPHISVSMRSKSSAETCPILRMMRVLSMARI